MKTNMIDNGSMMENEIVWTNAYRSLFKYGPVLSSCYVEHPLRASA